MSENEETGSHHEESSGEDIVPDSRLVKSEREIEIKELPKEVEFNKNTLILVTGGNGYLGSHIVKILLEEKKVRVRVSVRDINDVKRYKHLQSFKNASSRLEIVEGQLTNQKVWTSILKGCDAVIHCACPVPFKPPSQELEVIFPAVEGTAAILKAAMELGITRVIMTSSFSAIKGGKFHPTYSEEQWGDPEHTTSIEKSKIFSERIAWFYQKSNPDKFYLTTVCPGLLLGPCLNSHLDFASGLFFKKFMDGRVSSIMKMQLPFCDVRDAALVHIQALSNPKSINNRYICVQSSAWLEDFNKLLVKNFQPVDFEFPTKLSSGFPLKLISYFDPAVKAMLPFYEKDLVIIFEKLKKDFEFNFRNLEETVRDMGQDFIEKKFISKVTLIQQPGEGDADESQNKES